MTPATMYLILYNIVCCIGWAIVLTMGLQTVLAYDGSIKDALATVYDDSSNELPTYLYYVQTAALLEILHSALGLVRSPLFVTAMQVGSRIAALFAIVNSPLSQGEFRRYSFHFVWKFRWMKYILES